MVKRLLLAIPLFALLIIEWLFDLILKIWTAVHSSIDALAGAVQTEYKRKTKVIEPDSENVQ